MRETACETSKFMHQVNFHARSPSNIAHAAQLQCICHLASSTEDSLKVLLVIRGSFEFMVAGVHFAKGLDLWEGLIKAKVQQATIDATSDPCTALEHMEKLIIALFP